MRQQTTGRQWPWYLVFLAALLALPGLSAQSKAAGDSTIVYRIEELPLRPLAISNSGWVAGATSDQHAAIWNSKDGLFRIPLKSEMSFSEATGINNQGETVGTAANDDSTRRTAFLVRERKLQLLPGEQARATGINDDGTIVGQAILPGTKTIAPVFWKNESPADLHICCAGSARSINNQGLIVGDTYDQAGHYHAFVWESNHGARLVAAPQEEYSSAVALNSLGDVLLKVTPGGVFLFSGKTFQPIDLGKGTPRAMNRDQVVVGSFGPGPEEQKAFVWDKAHGLRDLNSLIAPDSHWTLEVASAINDKGEIVGWGDHDDEENVGFRLLPVGKLEPKQQLHSPHQ